MTPIQSDREEAAAYNKLALARWEEAKRRVHARLTHRQVIYDSDYFAEVQQLVAERWMPLPSAPEQGTHHG